MKTKFDESYVGLSEFYCIVNSNNGYQSFYLRSNNTLCSSLWDSIQYTYNVFICDCDEIDFKIDGWSPNDFGWVVSITRENVLNTMKMFLREEKINIFKERLSVN